jgi:acetate---CoA ligase (ADP-forming) subunit beta
MKTSAGHDGELHRNSVARDVLQDAKKKGAAALDEHKAKQIMRDFGVTVPRSVRLGKSAAERPDLHLMKAPYVLKALSDRPMHKSDIGALRLGLLTASEIADACRDIALSMRDAGEPLSGFLLEEMISPGLELIVGGSIESNFGPMIMVGAGGVYAEILQDVSFRLCPIIRSDAIEMISELKIAPILGGARGKLPIDTAPIVEILLSLGGERGFFTANSDLIAEFDLNPLIANEHGVIAVDARIVLGTSSHGG